MTGSALAAATRGFPGRSRRRLATRSRLRARRRLLRAMGVRIDQDVAVRVDATMVPRQDDRRRIHLDDDRWAGNAVAGTQTRSVVDARGAIASFHVAFLP